MLPQLEHTYRKLGKRRRPDAAPVRRGPYHSCRHHARRGHFSKLEARSARRTAALGAPSLKVEGGKGKGKISHTRPTPTPLPAASSPRRDLSEEKPEQAWWLDVANPPWEDVRTLGKVGISLLILLTAKLTRGTAVAPSPTDPGGRPTPGIVRETRVVFKRDATSLSAPSRLSAPTCALCPLP
jgi:hypothetical protein